MITVFLLLDLAIGLLAVWMLRVGGLRLLACAFVLRAIFSLALVPSAVYSVPRV